MKNKVLEFPVRYDWVPALILFTIWLIMYPKIVLAGCAVVAVICFRRRKLRN